MQKLKIKNSFTAVYANKEDKEPRGYDFTEVESQTVPNQALTIQEILTRFTTSGSLPIGKQVYYDDEDVNEPDPTLDPDFDLADATAIKEDIEQRKHAQDQEDKEKAEAEKLKEEAKNEEPEAENEEATEPEKQPKQ